MLHLYLRTPLAHGDGTREASSGLADVRWTGCAVPLRGGGEGLPVVEAGGHTHQQPGEEQDDDKAARTSEAP